MLVLKTDATRHQPDAKVIKAADYTARLEATQLLAQARAQATTLHAQARTDYEAEKKRGYEDGLNEGRAEMAEKMLETIAETVNYFEGIEQKTVEVVTQALERILGEMDQNELIHRIVAHALEVARTQKQVTLRVTPGQADYLRAQLDDILSKYPAINTIEIIPDTRLKAGGCLLETEMGFIDASIDVQLKALRGALLKAIKN